MFIARAFHQIISIDSRGVEPKREADFTLQHLAAQKVMSISKWKCSSS